MQFVGALKKELQKSLLKPKSKPTNLSKQTSDQMSSKAPVQTINKPTDIKMYLGYGYSLYTRTKNYNKSLSELKHKLQADKVPLNDQTTIINKFNEMF